MRKTILFCLCFLAGATLVKAQLQIQGTVTDLSALPVANQTVHLYADSSTGSSYNFMLQAVTNSSGIYQVTMPTGIPNGQVIKVWTSDCQNNVLTNMYTYSGSNITSDFSVCTGPNMISGKVILDSNTRAADAIVYFIAKKADSIGITFTYTLSLIDSTYTDTAGNYSAVFPSLPANSTLLVKAALLPASADYSNYLPTYYTSSLSWLGANAVSPYTPANNKDIYMISGVNPGGPAFVGGYVLLGANKGTAGEPLPERLMLLTDLNDNGVAYAYSDNNGKFSFNNIAYGQYKLFGDVLNKKSDPLYVTVSAGNARVNNIVFEESKGSFNGHYVWTTGIEANSGLSAVAVYPNPAKDRINITGLEQVQGNVSVTITDVTGRMVYNRQLPAAANISVPIADLPATMYLIKVSSSAGERVLRFIKQ